MYISSIAVVLSAFLLQVYGLVLENYFDQGDGRCEDKRTDCWHVTGGLKHCGEQAWTYEMCAKTCGLCFTTQKVNNAKVNIPSFNFEQIYRRTTGNKNVAKIKTKMIDIKNSDKLMTDDGRTAVLQQVSLDLHNKVRTNLAKGTVSNQPQAANMRKLTWSKELADLASNWAQRCTISHRKSNTCGVGGFANVGENIFATTVYTPKRSMNQQQWTDLVTQGVRSWLKQHENYRFEPFGPSTLQRHAAHYTQAVWSKTRSIGCAIQECHSGLNKWPPSTGTQSLILVCNYGPAGNVLGEKPYKKGSAGSKCVSGKANKNGLCVGRRGERSCKDTVSKWTCDHYKQRGMCNLCSPYNYQMLAECPRTCDSCHRM